MNLVPEGPDGGETFHGFGKVREQRELGGVVQLLQVPVQGSRAEWLRGQLRAQPGSESWLHLLLQCGQIASPL